MEDLHRQPRDEDRDRLVARIRSADDEGRIGAADRDIRLASVESARSMSELNLISRDLDQVDAASPSPPSTSAEDEVEEEDAQSDPSSRLAGGISLVAVIAVVAAALVVLISVLASGDDPGDEIPRGLPGPASVEPATPGAVVPVLPELTAGVPYTLTVPGISGFLQAYQQRFGTSRVVDLTLYHDHAVVNVPAPGTALPSRWRYQAGKWTPVGGVRAVIPSAKVVDTEELGVPALVRNIALARATLRVEEPTQTYAIVGFGRSDQVPSVDVHVANRSNESGYLATTLEGRVERAYPHSP